MIHVQFTNKRGLILFGWVMESPPRVGDRVITRKQDVDNDEDRGTYAVETLVWSAPTEVTVTTRKVG